MTLSLTISCLPMIDQEIIKLKNVGRVIFITL